jgi:hypothetical protein
MRAVIGNTQTRGHETVPGKLYSWSQTFKFYETYMCYEILALLFFEIFKDIETFVSLRIIQNGLKAEFDSKENSN